MSYMPERKEETVSGELNQVQWDLLADVRQWKNEIANIVQGAREEDYETSNHLIALLDEFFSQVQSLRFKE